MSAVAFASGYARRRPSRLRMTARGRAVLLALVAAPLAVVAIVGGINAGAATGTRTATPLTTITVASGESLWQVARAIAPSSDPREVIAELIDANRLRSSDVFAGELLEIPAQYSK